MRDEVRPFQVHVDDLHPLSRFRVGDQAVLPEDASVVDEDLELPKSLFDFGGGGGYAGGAGNIHLDLKELRGQAAGGLCCCLDVLGQGREAGASTDCYVRCSSFGERKSHCPSKAP